MFLVRKHNPRKHPFPLSILKKYESTRLNGYLLPVFSNAKYNLYLKEIGYPETSNLHLVSHTIATTVIYTNGVPIETISKMLDHTKLATIQIYARLVDQTVCNEMDKLSAKLSGTSLSLNGKNEAEEPSTDA